MSCDRGVGKCVYDCRGSGEVDWTDGQSVYIVWHVMVEGWWGRAITEGCVRAVEGL